MKLYCDTESIGLTGPTALIQFAYDDEAVQMLPTLDLRPGVNPASLPEAVIPHLRRLFANLDNPNLLFVAYNAAHDLFHLYRLRHWLVRGVQFPFGEPLPAFRCRVYDLYVPTVARSILSPFAFGKTATRAVACVRRVPAVAADVVAQAVEQRLVPMLPPTVSLTRHVKQVKPACSGQKKGELVTLSWTNPGRLSLKATMRAYGYETIAIEDVWPLPEKGTEKQHCPWFDEAIHGATLAACADIMRQGSRANFYRYSELDIHYLRELDSILGGEPDHHSDCAHAIAYARYYGMTVDKGILQRSIEMYRDDVETCLNALPGVNLDSSASRLSALKVVDPLIASSNKKVLAMLKDSSRPSAPIARAMLGYNSAKQALIQCEKAMEAASVAGRVYPTFRNIGTPTWRMSGEGDLNWQGVPQAKKGLGLRAAVETAAGGDWDQFEVAISAVVFQDEKIQEDLDQGTDAHSMNAVLMHPEARRNEWTYEFFRERVKKKDPRFVSIRKAMKPVTFGLAYFATAMKISETLGISLEEAEKALAGYYDRYRGFAEYKRRVETETQTADVERWGKHSVSRMATTVTDLTGMSRSWKTEVMIADILWQLGGDWGKSVRTGLSGLILRNQEKGLQTIDNAVKSALLGSAISIQAAVSRQRGNSPVQSSGANINKLLMARLWNKFHLPMANIHDELQFARCPWFGLVLVQAEINAFTDEWRKIIPSLHFSFSETERWSDK